MRKSIAFLCTVACFSLAAVHQTEAGEFRIPIASHCDESAPSVLLPPVEQKYQVNYVVSLRYVDHAKHLIEAPFPLIGSGFVSYQTSLNRTDYAIQKANSLQAIPVCTGYAATLFVDPISESEARIHIAVEHAYLSDDIVKRRLEGPPFTAAPRPTSTVIDKTVQVKSGEATSFDVVGDPEFARVELTFTTFKP